MNSKPKPNLDIDNHDDDDANVEEDGTMGRRPPLNADGLSHWDPLLFRCCIVYRTIKKERPLMCFGL